MKWYLSLVVALLVGTLGYQLFEMLRWTPTVESLSKTVFVRAPAQLGYMHSGGRIASHRPLLLDWHVIACGIGQDECDTRFRNLRENEALDAHLIEIPDGRGTTWLAMSMVRRSNGDSFNNSPERIVEEWRGSARDGMFFTVFVLVLFLLVYPACASARFRQAWWAMLEPAQDRQPAGAD